MNQINFIKEFKRIIRPKCHLLNELLLGIGQDVIFCNVEFKLAFFWKGSLYKLKGLIINSKP